MAKKAVVKKEFGLQTVKKNLAINSEELLKGIQRELVEEEQTALKDFIKGAYRLVLEKEKEMADLQKEVTKIRLAISESSKGNWDEMQKIKIPARFFEESTLRKHGKSLLSGTSEIRFMDLYINPEEE